MRAFYLPKHHPMPSAYLSHYESRLPPHVKIHLSVSVGGIKTVRAQSVPFVKSVNLLSIVQ